MLNKFELRLGNLYRNAETGEVIESTSDFICDVLKEEKGVEMYEGLAITQEWLEKAGFKLNDTFRFYSLQTLSLDVYTAHYNVINEEISAFGIETSDKNGGIDGSQYFAWDIKYVHQLQNLYYDLTNTTLEFTYDNELRKQPPQPNTTPHHCRCGYRRDHWDTGSVWSDIKM